MGLGCNFHGMDDWKFYAGYTWYENTSNETTIPDSNQYLAVSKTLIKHLRGTSPGILLSRNLQSQVQLKFDSLDGLLQRPFYFARNITGLFSLGLKALWITEEASAVGKNLFYLEERSDVPVSVAGSFNSSSRADSWGLGPKMEFQSNWLLGYGFSLIGSLGSSILYTSNTTLSSNVTGQVSNVESADLTMSQSHKYNVLNAVTETSLGFGWGTYFLNNNYHIDLSASYDFNVYWSRDVLDVLVGDQGAPGNMYLQGLNIRARFDF